MSAPRVAGGPPSVVRHPRWLRSVPRQALGSPRRVPLHPLPRRLAGARRLLRDCCGEALAAAPPHAALLWLSLALDEHGAEARRELQALLDTCQPAEQGDGSTGGGGGDGGGGGSGAAAGGQLWGVPCLACS